MSALFSIIVSCLVTITYGVALGGAGFAAWAVGERWFGVSSQKIDVATAFSFGVGQYAGLWILLGLAGWLKPSVVAPFLIAGFAYGAWCIFSLWPKRYTPRWGEGIFTLTGLLLLFCLIGLLALFGFSSLRPPFGDPVAFYLAWPKVIAASGAIRPLVGYESFCSIWMASEAHFAVLLELGGEHAAKFFAWMSLLAGARSMWLVAAECDCDPRGCLLAVLAMVTSTAVINVAVDGKTDLIAVAPALCSVLWALRLGLDRRATVLTGWLSGTAVSAKLTYIVPLGATLAWLVMMAALVVYPPGVRVRRIARWCVFIGIAAILVSIPQLIKNEMLYSNPLLPLIGTSVGRDVFFSDETTRRILLTLPLSLTFGNYSGQHGDLSPLVIGGLGVLVASGWWRDMTPRLWRVTLAAVIGVAAWFFVMPSQIVPRYFLAPLLLAAIPAAWALQRAWIGLGGRLVSYGVIAAAFFVTVIVGIETALYHGVAAERSLAAEIEGRNICIGEGYCEISETINDLLKPGERLLILSYYRYFLRADILQCAVTEVDTLGKVSAEAAEKFGINYVFVDRTNYHQPDYPVDAAAFVLIKETQRFRVYRAINPHPPHCIEQRPGYWKAIS